MCDWRRCLCWVWFWMCGHSPPSFSFAFFSFFSLSFSLSFFSSCSSSFYHRDIIGHNVIIIRQPSYHPVNHPAIRGERCFEVDWVNSRLVTLLPEEARACETVSKQLWNGGGHIPDIRSTCCDMFCSFLEGRRSSSFERNGMVLDMSV